MYILSDDDDDEFSPGNNIEVASDCGLCGWSKLNLQRFRLLVRELLKFQFGTRRQTTISRKRYRSTELGFQGLGY